MDIFKKTTLVRFCFASASMLPEGLGLSTEQLICLYKECIKMAKHCNDISIMIDSCVQYVVHSNSIGRHADSLKCLKEILPLAVAIPRAELIVYICLSVTYEELKEFENAVLHREKLIEIAQTIGDRENEFCGHHYMGIAFLHLARYDDAIDCCKKCLSIAQEIDSAEGEMKACNCILVAFERMEKYDDLILYAHKLLDCAMENNNQEAMMDVYLTLGKAHLALNQYQDATNFGQKCIEIAREIEGRRVEVKAYLFMGQIYRALSDYDNATDYYKTCIELAITIGDKDAAAQAYCFLGLIYYSKKKYDDVISNCNKCVHIDKEDNEEKRAHVIAYLTLGEVYHSLKKYDEAIQNYKQCLDIVDRIGHEKDYGAKACLYLGDIYERLEQYNDAVHYYKKCIDMAQETGEKKIEAQGCLGLSSVYRHTSGDEESIHIAIQYGKKCIDISQEIGAKNTEMEGHLNLARAYAYSIQLNEFFQSMDAGMAIATKLGDKKAEEIFKEVRASVYVRFGLRDDCVKEVSVEEPSCSEDELLQDRDQAVETEDKVKKRRALIRLYEFYSRSKKDYEKAINCLEQLKEMDLGRSTYFRDIGILYSSMGQKDKVMLMIKEGLSTAESCSDIMVRSYYYFGIGELHILNRELNLAEHYLRKSIQCFEAIFTKLGCRDEFKISICDKYIYSYKLLAALLIHCKQTTEALLVLDRCRARALKDLMISNFKMEQEESNDEHLEYSDVLSLVSRNDFSIAFYSLYHFILHKVFLGGETNSHYSLCLNHSLQIDVDRLFNKMGVREVVDCENRSLDKEEDIQKEQRRSKEEYEGRNQPTALLLNLDSNRGESNEKSAETKGSTLQVLFDRLAPSLAALKHLIETLVSALFSLLYGFTLDLEHLFDILECDRILSSKQDEVVIIPDGPLYKVPFPALRDPRTGKYLSETKRIRLAPSLATLKHFEDFPTDQTSDGKPLIIGNPLVGKVMMDGKECDIPSLPGAEDEADKISELLNTPKLLGDMATKPAVLERLRQGVSVVHIAAHGSLTKGRIALAASPEVRATKIPEEEDYMLTMADVQQAKVRAQLVVLSCCYSGRGEIRAEGVVSICRAFLASGARAVVASLWAIDDRATLHFMTSFYGNLKIGKSASTSLQLTMNEMRNTYKDPKYWAPFFIMGDDITLKSI